MSTRSEVLGTYTLNAHGHCAVVLSRQMGRDGDQYPFHYLSRTQAEGRIAKLSDRERWEVWRPAHGASYYVRLTASPALPLGWVWTRPRFGLGSDVPLACCRSEAWGDHVPDLVASSAEDAARQAHECARAGL